MDSAYRRVWTLPDVVRRYLSGTRLAFPSAMEQIEVMLKLVGQNPRKLGRFLDLGCGDGILGAALLEEYPAAEGVFLDFSPLMLDAAREKLAEFSHRIRLIPFDYADPNWIHRLGPDVSFDLIVSGYSIHHQPDQRKKEIYAEIYELLHPGGLFINIEHVLSPTDWIGQVHDHHFIDALWKFRQLTEPLTDREVVADDYYRRADKDANILTPVEVQCQWLKAVGFDDVDCYCKMFELAVFGGRK